MNAALRAALERAGFVHHHTQAGEYAVLTLPTGFSITVGEMDTDGDGPYMDIQDPETDSIVVLSNAHIWAT